LRRISIENVARLEVPLPPKKIQDQIVEVTRCGLGRLAAIEAPLNTSIKRLREFRAALITAAVTDQIDVATWGKRGEADRRLDQIEEKMRA
jgi:type I restriction enzyme S subunit